MRRAVLATLIAGSLAIFAAPAAQAQSVVVAASMEQTRPIDLGSIEKLPATELMVSFLTGHGQEQGHYSGALLWAVLEQTGVLGGAEPRARLHHTILVTGRDGYTAALALAEIDPEFEGKPVLLAYRRDGEALPGGELRLVVPGDKRGGRSVRDVVRIEVR